MAMITIVGCGPGARECLTLEGISVIEGAEIVIGTQHLFGLFPQLQAEKFALRGYRDEILEVLRRCDGRRVAVLVTGDPGLASLASAIISQFGMESCRVLPGISSVQVAFARLGMSWEGARIVSAHASTPELSFESLATEKKIAVLSGNLSAMHWISGLARALGEKWRIVVAQDLTLSSERVFAVDADGLDALSQPLRAVIVFYREERDNQ